MRSYGDAKNGKLSRRTLMLGAVTGARTVSSAGFAQRNDTAGNHASEKILNYNPNMEYRRCGKTGLMASAIGLGGHWKRIGAMIGAAEVQGDLILEQPAFIANRRAVVSRCIDAGINYVDASVEREVLAYSAALRGRRDRMYLGYSWWSHEPRFEGWRTTPKLLEGLDYGLRTAQLEYVDLWRMSVFTNGSAHTPKEVEAIIVALEKAKQAGKVRFTGIATHDGPWAKMMIETYSSQIDVLLIPYTADTRSLPKDSLFDTVQKYDVGVFGIKPFASNALFEGDSSLRSPCADDDNRRARLAIRAILANPAVTAPIPGLINVEQVDNVARAVQERRELDGKEQTELMAITRDMWARLPPDYRWLRTWEYA